MITSEASTEDLVRVLRRCRTILGNMAEERDGFWAALIGRRWVIHHEPLRGDARNLLRVIDEVLFAVDI